MEQVDMFRLVTEQSPMAIYITSHGRFIYLNPAALVLFAANSAAELIDTPVLERVVPRFREQVAARLQILHERQLAVPKLEVEILRLDGSTAEVEVNAVPFAAADRPCALAFARDISESKRAERREQQHQQLMQAIIDHIPALVFVKDLSGRYLIINQRYSEQMAIDASWLIGKTDYDLFPAAIADAMVQADHQVIKSGEPLDVEEYAPCADGLHTYQSVKFPLFDRQGDLWAVCGVATDITEKLAMHRARADTERKFLSVYHQAAVGILFYATSGQIEQANPKACSMLGYDAEELKVMNVIALLAEEEPNASPHDLHQRLTGGGNSRTREKRYRRKDGQLIWVDQVVTLIRHEDGSADGFVSLIADAEQRKQAEQALIESGKLAALGRLVAGMAHELSTPIGNCRLALTTLSERQREFIRQEPGPGQSSARVLAFAQQVGMVTQISENNIERAAHLISRFKQVAVDASSDQRRIYDLADIVDQIVLMLHPAVENAAITIASTVPPGIVMDGYPGALSQCLINLVSNAIAHAFVGLEAGIVSITATVPEPGYVSLVISDDGNGIPSEDLGKVFEPFYTTRMGSGSLGLGLHITYNLVHRILQGSIRIDSQVRQGSRFFLRLPRQIDTSA